MKDTDIKYIENLISEADFIGTSEAYSAVYDKLKVYDESYENNSSLEYYKGLVCYNNPDVEDFRTKWALVHFEKAIDLNREDVMPVIYKGYCLYDLKQYKNSLIAFKHVLSSNDNWIKLMDSNSYWRLVNIAEMIAVCNLKMTHITKFLEYYFPWKELYYLFSKGDDFYFPTTMVVEVSKFLKNKGKNMSNENIASFRKISLDLIGIIKGGDGFEEIYSEELKNLRDWDGHQQFNLRKIYS